MDQALTSYRTFHDRLDKYWMSYKHGLGKDLWSIIGLLYRWFAWMGARVYCNGQERVIQQCGYQKSAASPEKYTQKGGYRETMSRILLLSNPHLHLISSLSVEGREQGNGAVLSIADHGLKDRVHRSKRKILDCSG